MPPQKKKTVQPSVTLPPGRQRKPGLGSSKPVGPLTRSQGAASPPGVFVPSGGLSSKQKQSSELKALREKPLPVARSLRPRLPAQAPAPAAPAKPAAPKRKQQQQQQQQQQQEQEPEHRVSPAGKRSRPPKESDGGEAGRVRLHEVEHNGMVFRPGDCAYVSLNARVKALSWEQGEQTLCAACGAGPQPGNAVLECEGCLRGFHLACASPPLDDVPEGEWFCGDCASGGQPPEARPDAPTVQERVRAGSVGIVRILQLWRTGMKAGAKGGRVSFEAQWFCAREGTHLGRKASRCGRELFLEQPEARERREESLDCLLWRVPVLRLAAFQAVQGCHTDEWFCELAYHPWRKGQEFMPLADAEDGDNRQAPGRASNDFDSDGASSDADEAGREAPRKGKRRQGPRRALRCRAWELGLEAGGELAPGFARPPRAIAPERELTPLQRAPGVLANTLPPPRLPCREAEAAAIRAYLLDVITGAGDGAGDREGQGQSLYVSGMPGLGKTATVKQVVRELREQEAVGTLPAFQFVELNALRLASPHHAFQQLHQALTGERKSPAAALRALEERFGAGAEAPPGGPRGKAPKEKAHPTTIILLVDEMDCLLTPKQKVLYSLLHWPSLPGARLGVVGVANTLDLAARLQPRIASRLSGRRVEFRPYNQQQLQAIAEQRLEAGGAGGTFRGPALQLAAAKVAGHSGDVRRMAMLCRQAAQLALDAYQKGQQGGAGGPLGDLPLDCALDLEGEGDPLRGPDPSKFFALTEEGAPVVTPHAVAAAHAAMVASPAACALDGAQRIEKLLLAAVLLHTNITRHGEAVLGDVLERMRVMTEGREGEREIHDLDVIRAAAALGARSFLSTDPPDCWLGMRVALAVPREDVAAMLRSERSRQAIAWLHLLSF